MLDLFAMFFTLGALLFETEKKAIKTGINKDKAINDKKPYYWDGNNRRRSLETNEVLTFHGSKLIGAKTGRVYVDFTQQAVDEDNEKRKRCGSPVYMGKCKKHYTSSKQPTEYHLRERETNRLYEVDRYPVVLRPGVIDREHFRISYLDENLKYTGESKILPKELKTYYQGFYD